MRFGIFYELQLPRPWQADDELRLYQDALTELETADRLGYDYAWVLASCSSPPIIRRGWPNASRCSIC